MPPAIVDLEEVRAGFSNMAADYDAMAETNQVVIWVRRLVRGVVEQQLRPADSILEINCGSGLDAAYFAEKGYRVHATDIAPGMLKAVADKAARPELEGRLTFENLSNTQLGRVSGEPYDLILSNLGGWNCTGDPADVASGLSQVIRPGGRAVLVVMPPVCPWEAAQLLRGHVKTALRRFRSNGVDANVGGHVVHTWYHTPGSLIRSLGSGFEVVKLRSICLFAPPPYFEGFILRHPRLVERLQRLDERLGGVWPLNRFGDFYVLVVRKKS